jgi:hypothetical protein
VEKNVLCGGVVWLLAKCVSRRKVDNSMLMRQSFKGRLMSASSRVEIAQKVANAGGACVSVRAEPIAADEYRLVPTTFASEPLGWDE